MRTMDINTKIVRKAQQSRGDVLNTTEMTILLSKKIINRRDEFILQLHTSSATNIVLIYKM